MDTTERYLGIPRVLIPWYPRVDVEACTGCGACLTACKPEVYVLDDEAGKVVVAKPYKCLVFCQACKFQCEAEAISFPDKEGVKATIDELRKQYPPE